MSIVLFWHLTLWRWKRRLPQDNSPQLLGGCELKLRHLTKKYTKRTWRHWSQGNSVKMMAFIFWQRDENACSDRCGYDTGSWAPQGHVEGPTAMSMRGWRGGIHPPWAFPSFTIVALGKMNGMLRSKQKEICQPHGLIEALQGSPPINQTHTAKPKTHLKEDTFEYTVLTPSQMIPESWERAGRIYHDAYTYIFTVQQISIELNTKDFETSSKSVKEEVERLHF